MTDFFSIDKIFFTVLGYPMSYIEFFGTLAGGVAVWLSAKAKVSSWPIGVINVILFFFLFYQVQLYPDMFLQIFFLITNLVGWWRWTHPKQWEEDAKHELRVSGLKKHTLVILIIASITFTLLAGFLAGKLHTWFPFIFPLPSAFPFADSFVLVMSVITTFLMIQKKYESWIIWIIVDAVAAYLYFSKGIYFVSLEYLVFCFIAAFGLWNWLTQYRVYSHTGKRS